MNIKFFSYFVIVISLCSVLLYRWALSKFEQNVRKEYSHDYLNENGSINYVRLLKDLSEKKITNEKIINYSRLKDLSYWLMIFMVFMCFFAFGLKFFA